MNDDLLLYTPPALVIAGDFAKITLGPSSAGGFDVSWACFAFCDR